MPSAFQVKASQFGRVRVEMAEETFKITPFNVETARAELAKELDIPASQILGGTPGSDKFGRFVTFTLSDGVGVPARIWEDGATITHDLEDAYR